MSVRDKIGDLMRAAQTTVATRNKLDNIDLRYFKPKYWKTDDFGNLENTWCRFYTGDGTLVTLPEAIQSSISTNDITPLREKALDFIPRADGADLVNDVVVFGVSINISKSPKIIETNVKGFSHPVYTNFSTGAYDIEISFLESGPTFWQQNSHNIIDLLNLLNSGQTLHITNPQLELVYNIRNVVVKNYSIGQDPRFYSHNNISISLKSDVDIDIIQSTKNTI